MMAPMAEAQQAQDNGLSPGRRSVTPEVFFRTVDAVALCLRPEDSWRQFCDGLIRGYAEYAVLGGKACIPFGTAHRNLVAVFIAPEVVISTGYIDDWPALETAIEAFIRHYPCD